MFSFDFRSVRGRCRVVLEVQMVESAPGSPFMEIFAGAVRIRKKCGTWCIFCGEFFKFTVATPNSLKNLMEEARILQLCALRSPLFKVSGMIRTRCEVTPRECDHVGS